ncbi:MULTISPECIES: pyridoxal-phosphate-dependent aminotransferase family protein [unclassified Methanoculleus]|jgi:aspartate aminotransferase-like enzyme|uniref:Alanine--glyoxylate aminotransferase family protein n=1 Tax=Methanoculleus palmolei TaxID=72612 RepID=A0ABD8AAA6_9EURY|nr:alanine--glyoxylate aminotransferase family protein [Methanoculleus sp. UBA377]MDD2474174.1 alanine--glyoxylate aminotransferase family protein [Methanoculleus sp.]WOX56466.1 alanine--glyoxylate aminotransferase family protein [Methanoculleus palmolei]
MENEPLLMIPGPVPIPQRVRAAMTRQAINHRGPEFGAAYADTVRTLKTLFGTANELYIISGSGTAGMEAGVANFARDRKIVSLVNGKFGDRFAKIGARYGSVTALESEWGTPLDLDGLARELEAGAEVVTMVHNETSAGIKNPAPEVGKLARKHDALFIMDGVTSIGGDDVRMDEWGVDVAVVGSQKCLAAPAGLAAVAVSERAWDRISEKRPFYLDMAAYRKSGKSAPMETPYTPAVPLFLALHEACRMIEEEGVGARIARHHRMAAAVRAAAKGWGVDLFPKLDAYHAYSNTATAMRIPGGVTDKDLRGTVKKFGIEIAGGQDHLKGKIFRIGTMGGVGAQEILSTLAAVQFALRKAGFEAGDGVEVAAGVLLE